MLKHHTLPLLSNSSQSSNSSPLFRLRTPFPSRSIRSRIYSPFPLFFMKASSPPKLSSFSFALSFVLSLVLGLEMVA